MDVKVLMRLPQFFDPLRKVISHKIRSNVNLEVARIATRSLVNGTTLRQFWLPLEGCVQRLDWACSFTRFVRDGIARMPLPFQRYVRVVTLDAPMQNVSNSLGPLYSRLRTGKIGIKPIMRPSLRSAFGL